MTQTERDLHYLTIRQAADLLRERKLSPVELTRAFLDRIERLDGRLQAYITVLPEEAMAQAQRAEAEIMAGRYRGPLHGIPIALKDLYDTAGVRTTAGSRVMADRVPAEDATTSSRLKAAGAVLLGKLAMHEFAAAGPDPTSGFPIARNPWNSDHITGGSSTGSAAATAAGLCMGSLGSCTGGSIRVPASYCGIVGLKPTYGRVSRYGVIPLCWSLDHCGPMTRTVEDAAIMLQAIAGYDPRDPTASRAPVPDYSPFIREDVKGLRIGVPRHHFFADDPAISREILSTVEAALKALEDLDARVEEVTIPLLEHVGAAQRAISFAESSVYHEPNVRNRPQDLGEMVRARVRMGSLLTAADYVQAQRVRNVLRRQVAQVLQRVDVIASPTVPRTAPRLDETDTMTVYRSPPILRALEHDGHARLICSMWVHLGGTARGGWR